MLITCPECSHIVSDKAASCPNCGYPMIKDSEKPKSGKKKYKGKRMRLPNGFGRITKLTGKNLRKPFRAMVTVGTNEFGKPIGKLLKPVAYFETYNDAYQALMEYNKSPFDVSKSLTVKELHDKWLIDFEKTVSHSRITSLNGAWNYCKPLENIDIKTLKASQIKKVIDEGTRLDGDKIIKVPLNVKSLIKSMFASMLDYAMERDLVDKNVARSVKIGKEVLRQIDKEKQGHIPYSKEEMDILWEHENEDLFITGLLIQCYSGWRPAEMEELLLSNVDLENWTMTGGVKTESGKNRVIPIHSKIKPLVKKLYDLANENSIEYLFVRRKENGKIKRYVRSANDCYLKDLTVKLNISSHRLHDGRMTFVTNAKNADVNEYAIKRIAGHSIEDITESVYTIRDIEWLRKEIEKIP